MVNCYTIKSLCLSAIEMNNHFLSWWKKHWFPSLMIMTWAKWRVWHSLHEVIIIRKFQIYTYSDFRIAGLNWFRQLFMIMMSHRGGNFYRFQFSVWNSQVKLPHIGNEISSHVHASLSGFRLWPIGCCVWMRRKKGAKLRENEIERERKKDTHLSEKKLRNNWRNHSTPNHMKMWIR